jgi:diamine N-acetyltransferase
VRRPAPDVASAGTRAMTGRSVYLRALDPGDADSFQAWMNDQEVVRSLLLHRPVTREDQARFIERSTATGDQSDAILAIVRKKDDLLLGSTGLHLIDWRCRTAMFGIAIGRKTEWGKGYGTEATALMVAYAFRHLNLNRVWLEVYEFNDRGVAAYRRVGFRLEATQRQDSYCEGRYWDVYRMGLLRSEWERAERRRRS